ncbi:MAG: hypothetical protein ACOX7Z_10425 [Dysosmobacter sp.]|uniref:hypothetical protein n=1 Tax=Dysosmobacter sp. TaxID=2591382 RepID=UPI002671D71A|nr:hypothetical protein [Dysosmobacter sp.]MCI6016087.1 hypothetical protein [Dysosmobacter sp.]
MARERTEVLTMRLIDADKLDWWYKCRNIRHVIDDAPTVDAVPVVHGCFEPCFDENGNWRQGFAKCSNCGKEYYAQVINHFGYCPNCGAKMDGERKDGGDG